MNKKPRKQETDWGNEVAHSVGIIGKVFKKIFSYLINILLTIMLIGLITGIIVGGAFAIYIKNYITPDLESFEHLVTSQNLTTKIYYMVYEDRENRIGVPKELDEERIYGAQNRMWVSYSQIPQNLIKAFVAMEDKRFWDHNGVDWIRTVNATLNYFTGYTGKNFGASTITQQLIKNITTDDDVTIQRKVQEILRALELEKMKDKTEILELYLNTIFLSQRAYGVQAAATTYFGKDVSELTLIECAAIAAIPKYPTKYDPYQNPDENQLRRNEVLYQMYDQDMISKEEYESAFGKELILNMNSKSNENTNDPSKVNSWYKDAVIEDSIILIMEALGVSYEVAENMIYTNGLHIYTVMDYEVQTALEEIFENDENFLSVNAPIQPQCAMVVIDPNTGDILGLVGGRGEKSGNRILNYATKGQRPPGSAIKPISVYAPALDAGVITYGSVFDDVPINFGDVTSDGGSLTYSRLDGWPNNLPNRYDGLTTVSEAVKVSKNTVALRVLEKFTVEKSFDFMVNKLKINLIESKQLPGGTSVTDMDYSPLGLGELSYGLTVQEITTAYAMFANNGIFNESRTVIKILNNDGSVLVDNSAKGEIVLSDSTASIMTKMLQKVVTAGTAARITLKDTIQVAGKTGTTSKDNDRWFVGYTPYYVGGVWFGYGMPKSLSSFTTNPAVLVWDTVMTKLHQKFINEANSGGVALKTFTTPETVITKEYCKDSGMIPTDACKADLRGSRVETGYFTYATAPSEQCSVHVLVDYDMTTNSIAAPTCPSTVKKGFIRVTSRAFPSNINVTDAQYVYRDLPEGMEPSLNEDEAFFVTMLPDGTYVGISGAGHQYNSYCAAHYDENYGKEPDVPEETDNITDTQGPDDNQNIDETEQTPEETEPVEEVEESEETERSGPPPGYIP